MPSKPTLLAVSSELPWPLNTGGRLRTFHLLRAISRDFQVHLVAATPRADPAAVSALRENGVIAEPVEIPTPGRFAQVRAATRCAVTRTPYVLYARHEHDAVHARIRHLRRELNPRVLYFDHLDSCTYTNEGGGVTQVVDLHNIYSLIAERSAAGRSLLVRSYLKGEARLLRAAERAAAVRANVLFAVSEQELAYYRQLGSPNAHLVPNGVDFERYTGLPTGRSGSKLIVYIGSMSWLPNADAALFLAREVLPVVRERIPDARLRIIGRDPNPEVVALGSSGVEVTGSVDTVIPHLGEAAVLAVPLKAGGGTRLKILEAMAAGLPVVSTAVGAEGLDVTADQHLRIVERKDFGDAILRVLTARQAAGEMAARARTIAREKYDWGRIGEKASDAILDRLGKTETAVR